MGNVTCTVLGQKYGSNEYSTNAAAYAGFNYSDWYPFALKFSIPAFNGKSSKITFNLTISNGKREGASSHEVSLRYAICDSDANFSAYDKTTAAVTDAHQIVSGRISFSDLTASNAVKTMEVTTDALVGGKTYYLILWGDNTGGYYQDYCTPAAASNHTITLTNIDSYLLSISQGTGTTITVKRGSTTLKNGAVINYGDVLTITFSANTGYKLSTHKVNGSTFTSGGNYTVTMDVSVSATASVLEYALTINAGNGTNISVTRTSSPKKGAASGALNSGDTIYHSDVLTITFKANTGYDLQTHTVNGSSFTSGGSHTVTAAVNVVATASVLAYVLTINAGNGTNISVTRTSSPKKGAASGALNSGDTIYHSDVLVISFSVKQGYTLKTHTVNGSNFASGGNYTVTGNVNAAALATILACLIGGNGKRYIAYIKSGGTVREYTAYIKREGKWVPYGQ